MSTASKTLFSPRLWAANIQRLNPIWYAKLYKQNPAAAKEALRAQATFMAMVGTVLFLADKAPGVSVGTDMRSADFAKIKVGNTRFDIMGGQQQNMVQFWRQKTGEKVNSETGEITGLGQQYGSKTRFDLFVDMLINKSNPLISTAVQIGKSHKEDSNGFLELTSQYGDNFNIAGAIAKLGIPLNMQGIAATTGDTGSLAKGLAYNSVGFVGAGVNTYGTVPTKNQGKNDQGQTEWKGKVAENMVTDRQGKPILDAKGKPVTVQFPDGASKLEKAAILEDKKNGALKSQFTNSLSSEDKALMNLTDTQLKQFVKDKKIDQSRFDKIKRLQKGAGDYGLTIQTPEGVTTDQGKTFYKKWSSMDKKDQEAWLKQPPDANANNIATELNKNRSFGLSEFKPSNTLSKAYAEYEKDIQSHPEYSVVDKRNKAKAFQSWAYRLNYSETQKDIFKEGSSSDIRTLIDNKQISQDDLNAAIKMDNELFTSGLQGSLKFSKKFRNQFGFAIPDGRGGPNVGKNGGGSAKTHRAYLANLLPSAGTGKISAIPQFSRRTRNVKFKTSVTSGGGPKKKVSIKL